MVTNHSQHLPFAGLGHDLAAVELRALSLTVSRRPVMAAERDWADSDLDIPGRSRFFAFHRVVRGP